MDEVGKLDGVADEEHRQVVAHQVPVALLGAELHGESARAPSDLRRVTAAGDRRETDAQRSALSLLLEQLGTRVFGCKLVADLAVRLEIPVRDGTARVHDALRYALAVEVADLLQELVVLECGGAARADRPLALVVRYRVSLAIGQVAAGLAHVSWASFTCAYPALAHWASRPGSERREQQSYQYVPEPSASAVRGPSAAQWAGQGSNPRPSRCKRDALTS